MGDWREAHDIAIRKLRRANKRIAKLEYQMDYVSYIRDKLADRNVGTETDGSRIKVHVAEMISLLDEALEAGE